MPYRQIDDVEAQTSQAEPLVVEKISTDDYDAWMEAKAKMDYWKATEASLRIKICEVHLAGKTKGTHTIREQGYILKPVKNESVNVDSEILDQIWDSLSEEEQKCIKKTPSIIAKEYKALLAQFEGADCNPVLNEAITVKPAMPALKIEKAEPTHGD